MRNYSNLSISHLRQIVNGYQLESGWLEMGRILKVLSARLQQNRYKEILTEVAISDRTAAYLVAIVTRLDAQEIKVPQGIGWRKLAEVAPILTYDNQTIVFKKVPAYTREELIEMRRNGTLALDGLMKSRREGTDDV